jgi:hypothetical protein
LKELESGLTKTNCWYVKKNSKAQAEKDLIRYQNEFLEIVKELQPDAYEFNPSSPAQLQQLFFAPFKRNLASKRNNSSSKINLIKAPKRFNENIYDDKEEIEEQTENNVENENNEIENFEEEDPMKITRVFKEINEFPEVRYFKVEKIPNFDYPEHSTNPKSLKLKFRNLAVKGYGLPIVKYSLSGLPSVDTDVLKKLADGVIEKHFE